MTVVVVQDLIDLAERCAKATEGSREIDALIWCVIEPSHTHRKASPHQAPDYTGSIDDAVMLVPEGWTWSADASVPGWQPQFKLFNFENKSVTGQAATPALALCAAALRARASLKGEG